MAHCVHSEATTSHHTSSLLLFVYPFSTTTTTSTCLVYHAGLAFAEATIHVFEAQVRKSIRRHRRAGWSRKLSRRRAKLGKEITQWRKSQGHTVATASAAPAMIADLQGQLVAAHERIEELEGMNELLEEELESLRRHTADVDGYQHEDYASTTSSLENWVDELDSGSDAEMAEDT
ncbi:hypothetical protein HO173_002136 [Letharia columbiana]|uniref:Uncharacterized protein n=1 Tax=Letharia columbiana TaxID=112416 RepID=A0A8H6G319_9LECA|nr:uncharacterized protein HO173_002136 [Letharia columbiana]KAF6239591.1 hypothetical protein HO173_002136 [Letharia columbiana]